MLAGVSHMTMRLYEADPLSVKSDSKRGACAKLYEKLRDLLQSAPLSRSAAA